MPKVSAKRQITLPISGCNELGIQAGDEVEIFRHGNQFSMAAGLLKGIKINNTVSDVQSRQKHFE